MILRSYSRRTASFHQLFHYLTADGRSAAVPVTYNLLSLEIALPGAPPVPPGEFDPLYRTIADEFLANARYIVPRKNGVILYHEVISLAKADCERMDGRAAVHILYDLADFYLERRAQGALACGIIHLDQDNAHIHLVISANQIRQAKKLRLSHDEFRGIKRELEAYQRQRYPELTHSCVNHDRPTPRQRQHKEQEQQHAETPRLSHNEHQRKKRLERQGKNEPSRKQLLRQHLLEGFSVCNTVGAFRLFLAVRGITLYERDGRPVGVMANGKKYRFATLGLHPPAERAITAWQQLPGFLRACGEARAEQLRQEWRRETGYAAEIGDLFRPPFSAGCPAPRPFEPFPPNTSQDIPQNTLQDTPEDHGRHEIAAAIRRQRKHRRALYLDGHRRALDSGHHPAFTRDPAPGY